VFGLVESVHVELAHKTVHLIVPEILGQYYLLELGHVFYRELTAPARPVHDFAEICNLDYHNITLRISKVLATNPATSIRFYSGCSFRLSL
jgi:hypothetical protein